MKPINVNKELVRRNFEILNTGDVEAADENISPEFFNHEAKDEPPECQLPGPEGFKGTVRWLRRAFPDLHFEERDTIAEGDRVVSYVVMSGTHQGELEGMLPFRTGRKFSVRQAHFFRVGDDGKIAEHWALRDDLGMMQQLGVIPAPEELEEAGRT